MTGVYPKTMPNFGCIFCISNDLWAHPQQHRLPAGQPATSQGSRQGTVHTRALQTPSAGVARIPNINEIFYIKSWAISLMLEIRGVINVGQFSALANVNFWRGDFTGNSPQTTVPGIRDHGYTAGQLSKQTKPTTATAISKRLKNSLLMFHRAGEQ